RASAREAQGVAVVDARRHLDRVRARLRAPALAAAVGARAGDLPAQPAAPRTGRGGDHLAEDRLAHAAHLARPGAVRAGDGCRARARPAAIARGARDRGAQGDLSLRAEDGLLELDSERHLEVVAAGRPGGAARAAAARAEDGVEQVAEVGAEARAGEGVARPRACAPRRLGPEHVVAPPPLRVAQRLVRDRHLFEALLRRGITAARVGVQLAGELAVGALDLVLGGVGRDVQQLV